MKKIIIALLLLSTILLVGCKSLIESQSDQVCKACGYKKGTDMKLDGTQFECDNTTIIKMKYSNGTIIDKWGDPHIWGKYDLICPNGIQLEYKLIEGWIIK